MKRSIKIKGLLSHLGSAKFKFIHIMMMLTSKIVKS